MTPFFFSRSPPPMPSVSATYRLPTRLRYRSVACVEVSITWSESTLIVTIASVFS